MEELYIKVFTESPILVQRLQGLLSEANLRSRIKSDKIPAYEITSNIDELYVLNEDLEKALPIVDVFKAEIMS